MLQYKCSFNALKNLFERNRINTPKIYSLLENDLLDTLKCHIVIIFIYLFKTFENCPIMGHSMVSDHLTDIYIDYRRLLKTFKKDMSCFNPSAAYIHLIEKSLTQRHKP